MKKILKHITLDRVCTILSLLSAAAVLISPFMSLDGSNRFFFSVANETVSIIFIFVFAIFIISAWIGSSNIPMYGISVLSLVVLFVLFADFCANLLSDSNTNDMILNAGFYLWAAALLFGLFDLIICRRPPKWEKIDKPKKTSA